MLQQKDFARLDTPFGGDCLVLEEFDGQEGLGELFEYRIEALSEEENLDFDRALGQKCQVTYKSFDKERIFNGYLVEAEWLGVKGHLFSYRLVLRPWLWLLSRKADCRIFENKDALTIIEEIFGEHGYEFRKATNEDYPKLEYCVQYRETDFAFVSRLMELHGIYYFFEHKSGQHTLVLADNKSSHKTIGECSPLVFYDQGSAGQPGKQHLTYWSTRRRFRTGKIEFKDYNFEQPTADMSATAKKPGKYSKSDMEMYDYPGKYKKPDSQEGEKYAKVWVESEQAVDQRRHAVGNAANVFPGGLVNLSKHPTDAENIEYLVVRSSHSISTQAYRSGEAADPDYIYSGSYEFQPAERPFRMPFLTPEPRIHGIQTAKVVADENDEGEEISVDKHGRIRAEFHWVRAGRDGKKKPSCWMRCAQMWSGKGWGGQFIPRVGMEVVVEFLEGDPDRPLVIGTVYNGDNKHPYDLEDDSNKTQSGIKTDTTKGHSGYNELRFEDKENKEEIYVRAQLDLTKLVRQKEKTEIGEAFYKSGASREVQILKGDDELVVMTGGRKVTTTLKHETMSFMMIREQVAGSMISVDPASIMHNAPMLTENAGTKTMNIGLVTLNGNLVLNGNFALNGTLTINGGVLLNGKPLG